MSRYVRARGHAPGDSPPGKSSSLSRVLASHAPAPSNQPLTATPPSPHRSTTSLSRFVNTPRNIARGRRATPPVAARADARDRPDPFAAYTPEAVVFPRTVDGGRAGVPAASNACERRGRDDFRAACHFKPLPHAACRNRRGRAAVGPRSGPEGPSRDAPFRVTFPRVAATGFLRGARGIAVRRERGCTRGSFANRRVPTVADGRFQPVSIPKRASGAPLDARRLTPRRAPPFSRNRTALVAGLHRREG